MTQSTGAEAPEETTKNQSTEEATVTDEALLELVCQKDPTLVDALQEYRDRGELGNVLADMRERGPVKHEAPYTAAEADAIVAWWLSTPEDGPHGPDCQCDKLTAEELREVDALMARLAPALAEALGVGRTPAEKRTRVGDPEAAIVNELAKLQPLVEAYGKATGHIGTSVAYLSNGQDPGNAVTLLRRETMKARAAYGEIRDVVKNVAAWVPQVRGKHAVDETGTPLWFKPAKEKDGWLVTAGQESPGEDWVAVYTR